MKINFNLNQKSSRDPLYKKEVVEFIKQHKEQNGKPPTQKHFSIFVEETLCPRYKRPYEKIYHYISKFFNSNHSLYPKKYLNKTKFGIDVL